jgi:hypothetical protein
MYFIIFLFFVAFLIPLLVVRIILSTASQRNTSLFIRHTNLLSFKYKNLTEYNEPTNAHLYNKTLI